MANVCDWTWAEFFSTDIGKMDPTDFVETEVPRMIFKDWNEPGMEIFYGTIDYTIAVSRAVTDLEKMKEFYVTIMGGTIVRQETYSDGSEWMTV